jgi:hypothetical protein
LSERARKLVNVEYADESQQEPKPISALSQTTIDIRNESKIDALYNIELEFHVLNARVLSVGWEPPALDHLVEQLEPSFHLRTSSSSAGEKASRSYWEIRVPLAQLTSYEKYGESFRVGILADGELASIRMPNQGNKDNTSPDWRAKFVPLEEYQKEQNKRWQQATIATVLIFFSILLVMIAGFLWITFRLYGPFVADWRLLVATFLLGYVLTTIFGYVMGRIRAARGKMGASNLRSP